MLSYNCSKREQHTQHTKNLTKRRNKDMMIRVKSAVALLTNASRKSEWKDVEQMRLKMQLRYGREVSFGEAMMWV